MDYYGPAEYIAAVAVEWARLGNQRVSRAESFGGGRQPLGRSPRAERALQTQKAQDTGIDRLDSSSGV